jgi:hypothetical protein
MEPSKINLSPFLEPGKSRGQQYETEIGEDLGMLILGSISPNTFQAEITIEKDFYACKEHFRVSRRMRINLQISERACSSLST